MPRPKSPCGTYPAYQRHLREKTPVCDACREAQRARDSGSRRRMIRANDAPTVARVVNPRDRVRAMLGKCVVDLADFVEDDYLYGVVDLMDEMNELVAEWSALAGASELEPH